MAGLPTSSAWILLLLQLNAILFSPSVQTNPCTSWSEFHKGVRELKQAVENCPKNCSTAQMTVERKCQCLNLSMSAEDCAPPGFFIKGVETLNVTLLGSVEPRFFRQIIKKLKYTGERCQINRNSSLQREMTSCRSVTIISPKVFVDKLKNLGEELKEKLS